MAKRPKQPASAQEILARHSLDETDKLILKLLVEHPSITDTEIGAVVNLDRKAVGARRRKEAFQNAINDFLMPAKERIQSLVDKAARKYQKLLDSHDEKVVRNVAKDILISEGRLKNRVAIDPGDSEPLIIRKQKEVIEVHPVAPKKLPKGEG